MIVKPFRGRRPSLHPSVLLAENAAVVGDVTCGANVSIWYSATLRGDSDAITVGENCNIQESAVLHCDHGFPVVVGRSCVIGHGAIVHGCQVGEGTLIGMGATLLSGCKVGRGCVIGAGALITGNMVIPDGSLVMGVPGKVIRTVGPDHLREIEEDCAAYYEAALEQLTPAGQG